jgi:hypothetical protein
MGCLLRRGAYRLSYDREVVSSVQTAPVFGGFCGCQTPFSTHSFLFTHRSTGSPPLLATAGFFYEHLLCHQGSTATSSTTGTLLYSTPREDLGLRVYGMLRPLRGMCISLWTPTGELMSSKSGPMRGV